jgi:hypothetical protein
MRFSRLAVVVLVVAAMAARGAGSLHGGIRPRIGIEKYYYLAARTTDRHQFRQGSDFVNSIAVCCFSFPDASTPTPAAAQSRHQNLALNSLGPCG